MTAWQVEDNHTEPTIPSEMRQQLREASTTRRIDTQKFDVEGKSFCGNALLHSHTILLLAMIDSNVLLPLDLADRMIIGRMDWEANEQANIDLSPFGARERGVSRQHAALHRNGHTVSLVDLNSSNGTFINGVRLIPYQPRLLREGDELCFGSMRFRVSFDI